MTHVGWSPTAVRVVVVLGAVTAALFAAFVFVLVFHANVARIPRIRAFLHVNEEASLPTWWNAALLLTVAFCAFWARVQEPDEGGRRAWLLVGSAGALMSMDETASLHERLAGPVRSAGIDPPTFAWLIPGIVIAATGSLLLVRVGRLLPRSTRGPLLLALTVYAAGAIGVEAANGVLRDVRVLYYLTGTIVEELLEMVACILAVGTIVNHLTSRSDATSRASESGGAGKS